MAVVVHVQGGLGNQLFQFAFGEALSYKLKQPVYFDLSYFNNSKRKLGLTKFNTNIDQASEETINSFFTFKSRIFNKYLPNSSLNKHWVHFEKVHSFYNIPLNLKSNSYYSGYWQSEKYFKDITLILRDKITLRSNLLESNLLNTVNQADTVAIHFRRGDYLETNIQKVHGLIEPVYYHQAIKIILSKIPAAIFLIFSDDSDWIKSNLDLPCNWIFADTNSNNYSDEETLVLMSLCKHQIIANSTYSWWSAWLNSNPNKHIIAPKKWFTNSTPVCSMLPDSWIIL